MLMRGRIIESPSGCLRKEVAQMAYVQVKYCSKGTEINSKVYEKNLNRENIV
jgi:hypothetical protein